MKTVRKIITIFIVLILITGGVFAYLYFGTDLLKSNEQLFIKYLGQIFDTKNGFIEHELIEYINKKNTGKYENNGIISLEVALDDIDYDTQKILQDFNITYSGKVDNTTLENEQEISINYTNDTKFPIKYKYANGKLGLQSDYVSSKYIGLENSNLKEFAEKIGITETESIPDKIELLERIKGESIWDFTAEETAQLVNNYGTLIQEKLGEKEFTKDEENGAVSYSVSITGQEILDLYKAYLENLKNDSIIMPKLEESLSDIIDFANQYSSEEYTIDSLIQETIDDIESDNMDDILLTLTVYQTDGKLSAFSIKESSDDFGFEFTIAKNMADNNVNYNIAFNFDDFDSGKNVQYYINATYEGLEQLEQVKSNYEFGMIDNEDGESQQYINMVENTDIFNDSIAIEDFSEDEIQLLNDCTAEEVVTVFMNVMQRLDEVNTEQMDEIGFEEENPIMYMSPVISLGILLNNQMQSVYEDDYSSNIDADLFNTQFTQYEGEQRGSGVKGMLQLVLANNVGAIDEKEKVEVSGIVTLSKDDTEMPETEINIGSTYNVEIQYSDGLVSEIIVTEK